MKKRKIKKGVIIIGIIIVLSILLILNLRSSKNPFLGTWVSEGGTIYEFKEKKEGVMKTALSNYKFTYKVKGNILSIDFEEEKAIDTDYEYQMENDKCILKSDKGTFTFRKNKAN